MKIYYLLEKIFTGKNVKFVEAVVSNGRYEGNKVIVVVDLDNNKEFVLGESLDNFMRFRRWVGKEAMADYEPSFKTVKTNLGVMPTIKITTEVEIDDFKSRDEKGEMDL